jgi:hypothetical protein
MENDQYEWLEGMIDHALNPFGKHSQFAKDNLQQLMEWTQPESERMKNRLKAEVARINDPTHLQSVVVQTCNTLTGLMNRIYSNQLQSKTTNPELSNINSAVLANLYQTFSGIVHDYGHILDNGHRVPDHVLDEALEKAVSAIRDSENKLSAVRTMSPDLVDIIIGYMGEFQDHIKKRKLIVYRQLDFFLRVLGLIRQMDEASLAEDPGALTAIFIRLNINNSLAVEALKTVLMNRINHEVRKEQKILSIRHLIKTYHSIACDSKFSYEPASLDLKSWSVDLLSRELDYQEHQNQNDPSMLISISDSSGKPAKVLCYLSTDQLALILRSADDVKAIEGKSLNAVYKAIVPHLSTQKRENLSWESMRVKSYTGEDRDKKIAIATLEEMIKKIREY